MQKTRKWGLPVIHSTMGEVEDGRGEGGGYFADAPKKGRIWGLPTLWNSTSQRNENSGESRTDHFRDAANRASGKDLWTLAD